MSGVCQTWYTLSRNNDIWRWRLSEMDWLPARGDEGGKTRLVHQYQEQGQEIDWHYWFKQRYQLERRWMLGEVSTHYLLGHYDSVYCLQFDEQRIITGGRDCTIKFWNTSTYECTRTLRAHEGSVLSLQYNDSLMVSGSSDKTVVVWSMETFEPLRRLTVR